MAMAIGEDRTSCRGDRPETIDWLADWLADRLADWPANWPARSGAVACRTC